MAPLDELMANPRVLKVFHAALQDLEIFYLRMTQVPQPLFDTQVAAMVCGHGEAASYESLATKLANPQGDGAMVAGDKESDGDGDEGGGRATATKAKARMPARSLEATTTKQQST